MPFLEGPTHGFHLLTGTRTVPCGLYITAGIKQLALITAAAYGLPHTLSLICIMYNTFSSSLVRIIIIFQIWLCHFGGARYSSVVRAFARGAMGRLIDPSWGGPIELFLVPASVLCDWCNKGCVMYYPVCGMMHIKEPLLLIGKSSLCGGSGFPLSLSEWSFTICPTPYNRK